MKAQTTTLCTHEQDRLPIIYKGLYFEGIGKSLIVHVKSIGETFKRIKLTDKSNKEIM